MWCMDCRCWTFTADPPPLPPPPLLLHSAALRMEPERMRRSCPSHSHRHGDRGGERIDGDDRAGGDVVVAVAVIALCE